ncbi:MBL fold metallo-hydrolase [Chloroflexota bacterium]
MTIQKFGNHTYVDIDYNGANLGCIDTEKGLVLIDTPFLPDEIEKWQETVTKLCNKKITCVINTHHHFDHVLGNFAYSAPVIAHEAAYEEMSKPDGSMCHFFVSKRKDVSDDIKEQIYKIPQRPPTITFRDRMWLHLGDVDIELIHTGGHAESCIYTQVIEDRALFTGDVFLSNSHPFMGQANFAVWIKVLKRTLEMDVDFIIAGHGEIRGKDEVRRMIRFLQIIWDRVRELRNDGTGREKVIEQVHSHLDYYPLGPGEEHIQTMLFDEAVGKLYDQMGKAPFRSEQ